MAALSTYMFALSCLTVCGLTKTALKGAALATETVENPSIRHSLLISYFRWYLGTNRIMICTRF